jgi:ABC-type antimicrobial peptide transport system permease subunit
VVWRNLLRRPVRTSLTVLGVSVGLALIVALVSIADGYSSQFSAMLSSSGSDLTVMQANSADMALSAVDEVAGRRIAAVPGVAKVAGVLFSAVPMAGTPYFLVFGYDPGDYAFGHFKLVEGKPLSPRAAAGRSREIMLGRTAAESLKKRVGESVKLFNTPYRVVAIYETGISFEEGAGVVSLAEAQRVFRKPNQVSLYGVKLRDPQQADAVRTEILKRVDDITVSRSAEFAENTQDIQVTRSFAWAISIISVLAGGIGMMNTILMSVFERTREIGVLRALGWRRRWVLTLILQESLLLSFVGAVCGSLLGVGLGKLIELSPMGSILPTSFSVRLFAQVGVTALLLGAVGGLYPAYRASNLRPVEALHYE